jgi:hypothetical protein
MADYFIKLGDTAPPIIAMALDADRNPVNLTDADVRFFARSIRGDELLIDGVATLSDSPTDGVMTYDWSDGVLEEEGGYYGEFEVTFSDDEVETFPDSGYITIAVLADLEGAAS